MKQDGLGYIVRGKNGFLHILFYNDNIVRFAYSKDEEVPKSTVAVIAEPTGIDGFLEDDGVLKAGVFKVDVDRDSLAVKISDLYGSILSEDLMVSFQKTKIEKKKLWEHGIYGNGEKYSWLNQLGSKTINYNSDVLLHHKFHHPAVQEMHTAIPFFIGTCPGKAYGLFFDNSYRTTFDFAKSDPEIISFQADGGNLDYYFIYGLDLADVVKGYSLLTGTLPLPRRQILGYHQSRYSYQNQEELLAVAEGLRKHDLPCDFLYLDIHYMDAYKVFTVNKDGFKDFKEVLQKLKKMGFGVVVIINPGVKVEEGYRVFEQGKEKGYFVTKPSGEVYQGEVWPKPAAFPDYLRTEVRQWWGEFYRELLESGVEGIWNDMNEPSDFTRGSGTLPDDAVHRSDDGTEVPHAEVHNIYGLLQTRATREALEAIQPEKRSFVLTRAAFAGSQRYSALWTGDNSSLWEHMECSIPMILNLGLSGYSFVGADVGGFRGDCNGEMLARWTQLGAFIPFFRNHSEIGSARQEPWVFSAEVLEIVRKYICLRYQFLTYFYNLMKESANSGVPVARPLLYHYQDDLNTYHINDQFLLGEGLMVCPVVRPGIKNRMVYLPDGDWYDYWTGEKLSGGRYVIAEAPLDKLPLYVKAGTILPLNDSGLNKKTDEPIRKLTAHCYSGTDGYCRLYFDDGFSTKYRQGEYSELEIIMKKGLQGMRTEINVLRDGYPIPEIKLKIHDG